MLSNVFSSPADSPLAGLQVWSVRESKTSHFTRDKCDLRKRWLIQVEQIIYIEGVQFDGLG